MAIQATMTALLVDKNVVMAYGTLAFSGNYATGGDAIDFLTHTYTRGTGPRADTKIRYATGNPLDVRIWGMAGYSYEYDPTNKKVLVRQNKNPADAGGADIPFPQLAAAGYPGGVTGDTVQFALLFLRK